MNQLLQRVKEESKILHTLKRRKSDWTGHILRRNCLLKDAPEGKLEGRIRSDKKTNEEGDVSSYWMALRKREDTGN
jgi:hypothetical protein